MRHCSDEMKEMWCWKGLGFLFRFANGILFNYHSSFILPSPLILHLFICTCAAKSKQKNIPGKLKDIIYCLEGEMNGLLNSLDTDM